MAWTVTDHLTNYKTSGSPSLHPASTIAAGTLVVVGAEERTNTASSPTVTDTQGNTYTLLKKQQFGASSSMLLVFYCVLATQLTTSDTITYNPITSTNASGMLVLSATGYNAASPDASVTVGVSSAGGVVSLISGTPSVANELFVALGGTTNSEQALNLDSTNGWAAPFDNGGGSNTNGTATGVAAGGGSQVNAGTGTKTFNPTLAGGTPDYGAIIVAFKPIISGVGSASGSATVSGASASTAASAASASGTATVSGVGGSIVTATAASLGTATVSGVGSGILSGMAAASGSASAASVGTGVFSSVGAVAGTATALALADNRHITSTIALQRPVDYVLAGDQNERLRHQIRLNPRLMKSIFNER